MVSLEKLFGHTPIPYLQYIQICLYHETHGYYQKANTRVGRHAQNDFFTSRTLQGQVFDRLLIEGCRTFSQRRPADTYWVEIGLEPSQTPIGGTQNPYRQEYSLPLPCSFEVPSPAIVFFNEVLDAQPFHRFVAIENRWEEVGVVHQDNALRECVLLPEQRSRDFDQWIDMLPAPTAEGYLLDLPTGSIAFLEKLLHSAWSGSLVTFDYGKRTDELLFHTPQGTARTYYKHQLGNNLLARPTEEDITCHVWWDPLLDLLRAHGCRDVALLSQESFFMQYAGEEINRTISKHATTFHPDKQTIHQLIHPANMGQKFQVLLANRN